LGFGSEIIELLIKLRTSGHLHPHAAVIEIGAQQLANSFLSASDRISHLGRLFEINQPFSLPSPKPSHIVHGDMEHLDANAPFARDFWLWLEFKYAAIDIDGSLGSIPLDLNYDCVPRGAAGNYDLVTNFGTTEHVANQLNAFKVIHDLTSTGGVMIHLLPAQGMLNHGLINYNLKFFWMLGRSNGYRFIHADFSQSPTSYCLPDNIIDFLNSYDFLAQRKVRDFNVADAGIMIVMEKVFDIPFVPPIDVPTGSQATSEALKKRYWTVFEPNAFERLSAKGAGRARRLLKTLIGKVSRISGRVRRNTPE
jgi:hypothetical protein